MYEEPTKADRLASATAQYMMALPTEAVRLGWETIYALVRMALVESDEERDDGSGCEVVWDGA